MSKQPAVKIPNPQAGSEKPAMLKHSRFLFFAYPCCYHSICFYLTGNQLHPCDEIKIVPSMDSYEALIALQISSSFS